MFTQANTFISERRSSWFVCWDSFRWELEIVLRFHCSMPGLMSPTWWSVWIAFHFQWPTVPTDNGNDDDGDLHGSLLPPTAYSRALPGEIQNRFISPLPNFLTAKPHHNNANVQGRSNLHRGSFIPKPAHASVSSGESNDLTVHKTHRSDREAC